METDLIASLAAAGIALGIIEGIKPGPLLTMVIRESLSKGLKAGMWTAAAPIFTDDPIASSSVFPGSGGSREKHSSPILVRNNAPRSEIENRTCGCVAIQPARNRLAIIIGPSVKMGAAAVHIPAFSPLERDSLITMVRSGPGLMPSMVPSAIPVCTCSGSSSAVR